MKFNPSSHYPRSKKLLLIGVWANRNWVLGNMLYETKSRYSRETQIFWVPSVYARKHWWERLVEIPLPEFGAYYFSYLSIFESYLEKKPEKYRSKSIVLYTHNLEELGSLDHQAEILNSAYRVHFDCSSDAENLLDHGLNPNKVKITYGAIDDDCRNVPGVVSEENTILLASRYGSRKGLHILPEIVAGLPKWKFLILGRGWEKFMKETGLDHEPRVEYIEFNKRSRNIGMSRARFFLSLSSLEGGPIPLIESMSMGLVPIATNTGFARDLIDDGRNGIILPRFPKVEDVIAAVKSAMNITESSVEAVKHLTWDKMGREIWNDAREIIQNLE